MPNPSTVNGTNITKKNSPPIEEPSKTQCEDYVEYLLKVTEKNDWTNLENSIDNLTKFLISTNGKDYVDIYKTALNKTLNGNGQNLFHLSVRSNRSAIIDKLINLGMDINEFSGDGMNVLHVCALHCKEDIILHILRQKININSYTYNMRTILHIICMRTNIVSLSLFQNIVRLCEKDFKLQIDQNGYLAVMYAIESHHFSLVRDLLRDQLAEQLACQTVNDGNNLVHLAAKKGHVDVLNHLLMDLKCDYKISNNLKQNIFHILAIEGNLDGIRLLLTLKADPELVDAEGRTPIHLAAEYGHNDVINYLIDEFKCNVTSRAADGSTLMHIASERGHLNTALLFMKRGIALHMPNKDGAVCLHAAAKYGHYTIVRALLHKGANIDSRTKDDLTPLHLAVENDNVEVVQLLLGSGAKVQIQCGSAKESPLHSAAKQCGSLKSAEMLLKSGANPNMRKVNGETPLHVAARYGNVHLIRLLLMDRANAFLQSESGDTPLHICVRYCNYQCVYIILKFVEESLGKFDAVLLVNTVNYEGETATHLASELKKKQLHSEFEDVDIMKLLLIYEADLHVHTKLTMETPLHYAARGGNSDILLEILKFLPNDKLQLAINDQSKNGWSPLLTACSESHTKFVHILLQYNARIDVFDELGQSALHLATTAGNIDICRELLMKNAFVNSKTKSGLSPLHIAAKKGRQSIVRMLVEEFDAAIETVTLCKKTVLHIAAQYGRFDTCKYLLSTNVNLLTIDSNGATPLHLAAEQDHAEIIKLFLQYQPDLMEQQSVNGDSCIHIASRKGSIAVMNSLIHANHRAVINNTNPLTKWTSLHSSADGGHAEIVRLLLERGADPNIENLDGMAAVHLAAKGGHLGVIECLKRYGDLNYVSEKIGLTALHIAAHYGKVSVARELLANNPSMPSANSSAQKFANYQANNEESTNYSITSSSLISQPETGLTPLHLACYAGHESMIRLLLNCANVQVNAKTETLSLIPLHLAAMCGHIPVVGLLLSKDSTQVKVVDVMGRCSLHFASANGHREMVRVLLGQGCDINTVDNNEWTPLHFAASKGYSDVVQLLIENGSETNVLTNNNKLPVCYAAANNHVETLMYLMKKYPATHQLMKDKKFLFNLVTSGKLLGHLPLKEFVILSPAPADTAAKLSKIYSHMTEEEKERVKDLGDASMFCENLASEFLTIASTAVGPSKLLKAVDDDNVVFLDVLIDSGQKNVVAHGAVQGYLSEIWYNAPEERQIKTWKLVLLFIAMLIFPPLWILLGFPILPFSRIPVVKFMIDLVSHIYWLFLLCCVTIFPIQPVIICEILLLLWLMGYYLAEFTQPTNNSSLAFLRKLTIIFGTIAFIIHIAFVVLRTNESKKQIVFSLIYSRNQFLGINILLGFIQFLDFLTFHHLFGPWAIIIRDLMKDLARFVVILAIFLFGFALQLTAVHDNVVSFTNPTQLPVPDVTTTENIPTKELLTQPHYFLDFLFFSLFGLGSLDHLAISYTNDPTSAAYIAKAIYGMYLIVSVIVLINLLIAMMSDTYQRIQQQSDIEWKFGRAKLIRSMSKRSPSASPLNLISRLFKLIITCFKFHCCICSSNARSYFLDATNEYHCDCSGSDESSSQSPSASTTPMLIYKKNSTEKFDKDYIDLDEETNKSTCSSCCRKKRTSKVDDEAKILTKKNELIIQPNENLEHIDKAVDWNYVLFKYLISIGENVNIDELEEKRAHYQN
ncbi:hypothetical protein SNEBB_006262 [Seison nebaliae]|nr:hypothetical protein SNEBB_006262 [Seison nebaliae]